MSTIKPTDPLCARCLLGHGASPYDQDRPGGHEKLARVLWHGVSLCVECFQTLLLVTRTNDW